MNGNAGGAAAGMLCALVGIVIGLLLGLAIGAVILRAAISLFNKMIGASGKPVPRRRRREYDDEDDRDDDRPRRRRDYDDEDDDRDGRGPDGVPEPSFGRAMLIVLAGAVVNFGINMVLALVLGGGMAALAGRNPNGGGEAAVAGAAILVNLLSVVIGFLVNAGVLTGMLPTSFGRACVVTLLQYVIVFMIAAVILGGLFAVGIGLGGFGR